MADPMSSPVVILNPGATISLSGGTKTLNVASLSISRDGNWLGLGTSDGWSVGSGSISRLDDRQVTSGDWKLPWGTDGNTLSGTGKVSVWLDATAFPKPGVSTDADKATYQMFTGYATEWAGSLTRLDDIPIEDTSSSFKRAFSQDAYYGDTHAISTIVRAAYVAGYYNSPNLFDNFDRAFGYSSMISSSETYTGPNAYSSPIKGGISYNSAPAYGATRGIAGVKSTPSPLMWYVRWDKDSMSSGFHYGFGYRTLIQSGCDHKIEIKCGSSSAGTLVVAGGDLACSWTDGTFSRTFTISNGVRDISYSHYFSGGNKYVDIYVDNVRIQQFVYAYTPTTMTRDASGYITMSATLTITGGSCIIAGFSHGEGPKQGMNNGYHTARMLVYAAFNDFSDTQKLKHRPYISGECGAVIGEIAGRIGANVGINRYGDLELKTWRYVYNGNVVPVATFDVNSTLADLNWSGLRSDKPRLVKIRRRKAGVSAPYPIIWVSEDKVLESGWESTEYISPPENTDWINVDTTFVAGWNNTSSCMEGNKDPSSTNSTGTASWTVTVTREPDVNAWKVYFKNLSPAGVNENYRFNTGPYVGGPSPVIRSGYKLTWVESIQTGNAVGPPDGPEYIHDGDWCLSDWDANDMLRQLESQINSPYEKITGLKVWPNPNLNIGDHVTLRFAVAGSVSEIDYVEMLVTGINDEIGPGSYSQTLSGRVLQVKRINTWDSVDAAYASQYGNWDSVDSAKSSKMWDTVDASPLS